MDSIEDALAIAEHEWRALGVAKHERANLAADLRADLAAAAADGVTPGQLIGPDLRGFARRLADEAGARPAPRAYGRVVRTALTGALLGAAAGFAALSVAHPLLVGWFDLPRGVRVPLWLAAFVYYGAASTFVVAGAVVAIRVRLRDVPGTRRTANATTLLMPAAGALVTPIVMAFARLTGYSLAPLVVATEAALVLAAAAAAVLAAHHWSLRRDRPAAPAPLSSAAQGA